MSHADFRMVVSTPSSGDMTISTSSLTDTATTTNTEEGYDWSTITAQAAVYEGRKAPEIPQPPQPQQQPHHQSPHPHAAHPQVAHPQPHLDRLHRMPGASSPITQATHFHAALTLPRHFAQSQNPAALSPNPVPHSLAPQTPGALALTPTDVNLPTYFSSAPSPANPPPPLRDSKSQTLPRLTRNTSSAPLLSTSQKYLAKYPPHPMITKEYIMGEELGVGGFGFVVAGERRDRGGPVAVKFIFRSRIPPTGWARDPDLGVVPMEVYILKNVRHKNIVRFLDYIEDERFCILVEELHGTQWTKVGDRSKELVDEIDKMSISDARAGVAEAKATGLVPALVRTKSMDLFECIERHYRLPEKMAKRVFGQIADAVSYLHSKGVVHRDIKDENIVIDADYSVKLIDFGSAAVEPRGNPNHLWDRFMGTVQFAAPEILRGDKYRGRPADVWAMGVLLYTVGFQRAVIVLTKLTSILYGENPFSGSEHAILGSPKKQPHSVSPEAEHLLDALLRKEWRQRPTAEQVMQHPWLRDGTSAVAV